MKSFRTLGLAVVAVFAQAHAQTAQPAAQRSQAAGTVTAVAAPANQVSFKNDKGEVLTVTTSDRTQILHAQAGEADPKKWANAESSSHTSAEAVG